MSEPLSYWQATTSASLQSNSLPNRTDVVVIGGGLHGVSVAYWLARMGARPLLIERGELAAGATGRNGGLVVAGTAEAYPTAVARFGQAAARAIWQTTVDNHAALINVLHEEQIDASYRDLGHVKLALSPPELAAQQQAAALLRADGFATEMLDRSQVAELIATPLAETIVGGSLLPYSGTVHSAQLVYDLALAAQRHGAQIVTQTAVQALEPAGDGVRISTTSGIVQANRAVLALNAWSGTLLAQLAPLITPVRGQALAYEPVGQIFRTGCSAGVTPTGEYWQQTAGGTIIIGGCRAIAPDHDLGMRPQTTSAAVQAAIETILPQLFPQLPPLRVAQRWAGTMAFTADYTPIADRVPDLPAAWVVGGFSGHGMPFGMIFGRGLAESVLNNKPAKVLLPFAIERLIS